MLDAETGAERLVDTSSARVRAAYAEHWRRHDERLRTAFVRSGVDHVKVRTDDDYVRSLIALFKQRA